MVKWLLAITAVLAAPLAGAAYLVQNEEGWAYEQAPGLREVRQAVVALAGRLQAATAPDRSVRYITAPAEMGQVQQTVTATGTLEAVATVEVSSQLSGQVSELLADFNDDVEKEQPLAQLDRRSFEARRADAAAAVEMAKANIDTHMAKLERAEVDLRDADAQRAVLAARLENAKVRFEAAESAFQRKRRLADRKTISSAELEDARALQDSAAAAVREAEAVAAAHAHKIAGAEADVERAKAELVNARASLPQKEAQLRLAEIDLERATIRSPIKGLVVGRNVEEGQTVAASLEAPVLFTIAGDLGHMEIHARIDEADIGEIAVGQKATFTVDAHPGTEFSASVSEIRKAPQVLQNVVTYTVVLKTANPGGLLLPGMTALVRIVTDETGPVLKVPLAALRFEPRTAGATALASNGAHAAGRPARLWALGAGGEPRAVSIAAGPDDGADVAVLGGELREGDEVVLGEVVEDAPRRLFGVRVGF